MIPVTFELNGELRAECFHTPEEALLFAIEATRDPDGPKVALVHGEAIIEVRDGEIME